MFFFFFVLCLFLVLMSRYFGLSILDYIPLKKQFFVATPMALIYNIERWSKDQWTSTYPSIESTPEIQTTYDDVETYYQAFFNCSFEELRASVRSSIGKLDIEETPPTPIVGATSTMQESTSTISVNIEIRRGSYYKPKFNDVIIVVSQSNVNRIEHIPVNSHPIGIVRSADEDGIRFSASFHQTMHFPRVLNENYVVFPVGTLTVHKRIIHEYECGESHPIIEAVMTGRGIDPQHISPRQQDHISALNESQNKAAQTFLAMRNGVLLVQGPPGTGKSTLIAHTVSRLRASGLKVLVCAPTNYEVQNIALKYVRIEELPNTVLVASRDMRPTNSQLCSIYIPTYEKESDRVQANRKKVSEAEVLFCTTSSAGSSIVKYMRGIQALIVDEAARAIEAEMLIPLGHHPSKVMFVGDTKQLVHGCNSNRVARLKYGRSIMTRMVEELNTPFLPLELQYRMTPEISYWPRTYMYPEATYGVIHVDGQEERNRDRIWNPLEADWIVYLVQRIRDKIGKKKLEEKLVVLSFYKGQVRFINNLLRQQGFVELAKTVDSYQGREMDIVLLSFVRANEGGDIGFLEKPNRLNVAMTRAKFVMLMVGNVKTLEKKEVPHMVSLFDHIEDHDGVYTTDP
eukprot:TRINITY_DN3072_c0_g1_i1.p1 TRINITY_DN3072_c0_g1~~TRINITY_DN3072_c0_g1_i1.p1  ORF type:complete len:628 (-),score=98.46 TRINITY_DN3072_c0_g1_i1:312-2195(-)